MKSIRIKKDKVIPATWISLIILAVVIFAFCFVKWQSYKKGQNAAVEITKEIVSDFKDTKEKNWADMISSMHYHYVYYENPITYEMLTYNDDDRYSDWPEDLKLDHELFLRSMLAQRAMESEVDNKILNEKMEELGYWNYATWYLEYPTALEFWLHSDSIYVILFSILAVAFLLLLAVTLYQKSDKSELAVDGDSMTAKRHNGKSLQFLLKDVTNVESKGKHGLIVKGHNITYTINRIQNADDLKATILEGMARFASILTKEEPGLTMPDVAEDLKKLKDLLDRGILTQEEFDAKKKQMLGL